MLDFFRNISGPITMHLELTEACPERCRHCYNFVREPNYSFKNITKEDIDLFLDDFKSNGGFHVILTGGEPLLAFDKLLYAVEGVKRRGMSLSVNSSLMLATAEKMKTLKEAGVDHILSTLFSHDPHTHDFIASRTGSFNEIIKGINITRGAGIRVSINMIVTTVNETHVYETGKLLHSIGLNKFIANRMIPSTLNSNSLKNEFLITEEPARRMLDDLLRLNKEFGMTISSCRALPHCFLGDLDEHFAFTARGCNAGKRHLLVNCDGTARACVHEAETYGNVHEIGIKGVWENMGKWRRKDLLPKGCQECALMEICEGACRQIAEVVSSDWSGVDNLDKGPDGLRKYHRGVTNELVNFIKKEKFFVNPEIEFRKEDGCYLIRILGAKCVLIENHFADFLIKNQETQQTFALDDFPERNAEELGLYLVYDMVHSEQHTNIANSLIEQYRR